MARHSPGLRQLTFVLATTFESEDSDDEDDVYHPGFLRMAEYEEHLARMDIPTDLFQSLSNLHNLAIQHIPFITPDFTIKLVERLSDLPNLQTLRLVPSPISSSEHHQLKLPDLLCLQNIATSNPSLNHITPALNVSTIPTDIAGVSFPGHAVQELFIVTQTNPDFNPELPQLISLSTYLDSVFPNIQDMTSYFVVKREMTFGRRRNSFTARNPLEIWKDVENLIKSHQSVRKRVQNHLQG